ncbi:MAG: hypothetical protein AAGG50_21605, partial [Bacteroidota bacterium]
AASVGCDSSSETDPPDPVDPTDGPFGIGVVAETPGGAPVEGLRVAIRPCFEVRVSSQNDACMEGASAGPEESPVLSASARVGGVELTGFDAIIQGANVLLLWGTASETDNRGFEVQMQEDGADTFSALGFVDGAGTTVEPQTYSFETTPGEGVHTFRLRQEDLDGTSTFSGEVTVAITAPLEAWLSHGYPSPFRLTTVWEYATAEARPDAVFEVIDLVGNVVFADGQGTEPILTYRVSWDGEDHPSGVYAVRLRAGDTVLDSNSIAYWAPLAPDATDGADVRGQTDTDGRLVTGDSTLAPAFYGPAELEYRDEQNSLIGIFSMPPRVRITLIDPATGARQTYDRDIEDGPNAFVLTWDPA